jgi:hypothetical protein
MPSYGRNASRRGLRAARGLVDRSTSSLACDRPRRQLSVVSTGGPLERETDARLGAQGVDEPGFAQGRDARVRRDAEEQPRGERRIPNADAGCHQALPQEVFMRRIRHHPRDFRTCAEVARIDQIEVQESPLGHDRTRALLGLTCWDRERDTAQPGGERRHATGQHPVARKPSALARAVVQEGGCGQCAPTAAFDTHVGS